MRLFHLVRARFPKGRFARRLLVVAGGTAFGQLAAIAVAPILSRLYTPNDFGLFAIYTSVVTIVAIVAALGYQLAIVLPEADADAAAVFWLALGSTCGVAALALGATALLLEFTPGARASELGPLLWLAPLGVLGAGMYEVLSQWTVRRTDFAALGRTMAERGALQAALQVGGGVARLGALGLVAGQLAGQWFGTLRLAVGCLRRDRDVLRSTTAARLRDAAARYRRFPLVSLPAALVNALDSNATPLLLTYYFGLEVAGLYALGVRVLAIPFSLIANSAQKVFFPAAVEARKERRLAEETRATFSQLFRAVLPLMVVLIAAGPELFSVVFGGVWRDAGVYLQWLSVRTCFTLVVFPLTPLIFVLERQGAGFWFSMVQLATRVGALIAGGIMGKPLFAIAFLGVTTAAAWLGYLAFLWRLSGNGWRDAFVGIKSPCLVALACATPLVALKLAAAPDLLVAAAAVLALGAGTGGAWLSRVKAPA